MKISYKGDYALKSLIDLGLNWQGGLLTIADMAERLDIPRKFLEQVLLNLKQAGCVESVRGKFGGYKLARPPKEIIIGNVVRLIDGPIEPIACVNNSYTNCREMPDCVMRQLWIRTTKAITDIVDATTLEDLINDERRRSQVLEYCI